MTDSLTSTNVYAYSYSITTSDISTNNISTNYTAVNEIAI